jgi:putative transposase
MKKRFTEEQIIGILKEAEAGLKVAELCRKHGISDATYYNWKAKFGGMTVSDAQRLKALEIENACIDPVKTCSGVNLEGVTRDEHGDGRRNQTLDGEA